MAEATEYMFKHEEVATALVKKQGIHEGRWALSIRFGFGVTNIGEDKSDVNPAAIIPVVAIGIRLVTEKDQLSSLTVDAAVVNPKITHAKTRKTPA